MTHVLNVVYGIGAALASAACFYLAGLVLVPRRWESSVRDAAIPFLGAALYVLLCWIASTAWWIPLNGVLFVFVGSVLALSAVRFRRVAAAVKPCFAGRTCVEGVSIFALFYVLAYVLTRPPASDLYLPPAWNGNLDLLTHVRYAKHLLLVGSPNLDAASFDYLRSPAISYLLAGFSLAYRQDPLSAAMPAELALAALVAFAAVGICRAMFHLPTIASMAVACILVTSPFFTRVTRAYDLAALAAISILLYLLWATAGWRPRHLVSLPLAIRFLAAFVLLFFIHPLMLIAALALQAVVTFLRLSESRREAVHLTRSAVIPLLLLAFAFADRVWWASTNGAQSSAPVAAAFTLAFVVLAGTAHLLVRPEVLSKLARTPTDRRLALALTGYVAISVIVGHVAVQAKEPRPIRLPGAWRGIAQLDDMPFRELTLKIASDPEGWLTAVARYYLPMKKVRVLGRAVRTTDLPFEAISPHNPLLIQNFGCEGVGHRDTLSLGLLGCVLFAPPSLELGTLYPFNRTVLSVAVDRMSEREPGGRWSTGGRLPLRLVADPQRMPLERNLYVNLFVTPFLPPGVKPQRLVFTWGANRQGEVSVAERAWISVPVGSSDWTGNRVWVLPISISFPDGRTILFHDLSLTENAAGRVVE